MGALFAVDEREVEEGGLAVAHDARGDAGVHLVEVERDGQIVAGGQADRVARLGRQVLFGLDARDLDVGGVGDVDGQAAVFGQEGVGVELGSLVEGAHVIDHAVEADRAEAVGALGLDLDDVVQAQDVAGRDGHPELERGGVFRAHHEANGGGVRHSLGS
ncbi:hypothetical protein D3C72_1400160 [compost metagenome]